MRPKLSTTQDPKERMTADEAADHQWLRSTNCKSTNCKSTDSKSTDSKSTNRKSTNYKSTNCKGRQNQESKEKDPKDEKVSIIQPLTDLEPSEMVGGDNVVEFEANNWLSSSRPFVSVCLSLDEEETVEVSSSTREAVSMSMSLSMSMKANHLSLSSTSPPAKTCPLLTGQKGGMVIEQEEEEEKKENVAKMRRKRAREEAAGCTGLIDAKKKRLASVCEREDRFGAETEKTCLSKIRRRGKRKKARFVQGIKMRN